jgi:hypothetical protein
MDFPLVSFDPYTGLATVGIPKTPRPVRGIQLLVQIVVIAILKNQGQDVFTPLEGAGLRGLIGQMNYSDPSEIKLEVIQRINKIAQEIITNQVNTDVGATEKLASLKVLEVISDPVTADTAVRLKLTSEAGQTTSVVV